MEIDCLSGLIINEQIAIDKGLPIQDCGQRAKGSSPEQSSYPGFITDGSIGTPDLVKGLGSIISGHNLSPDRMVQNKVTLSLISYRNKPSSRSIITHYVLRFTHCRQNALVK
jgi:hypothetical protein